MYQYDFDVSDGVWSIHSFRFVSFLGNMWAQQWNNIYDIVEPFPNQGTIDVTKKMKEEGWTITKMFQVANKYIYYLSIFVLPWA